MVEQEITYIPYGQNEISQQDLMTSLANGIDSYLGSKNWAKKDKYRQAWLNAYQDIMNRGILGASNDTGMWRINHKGSDIDMSGMSNIQREMYGDAAYYIQQQMARMTPRIKEEDKKKDENKTKFDNREFNLGLTEHVGKAFGGMDPSIWNKRWAELDPEERGIRGTAGRQAKMAEQLASFRDKISADKDKYSFEDTPYGSFDEWNNRVERALKALGNSEWNDDDKNALDALGINYDEWFKTGADEPVTLADGSTMTRAEFNALEDKQKAEKVAAENAAKTKQFHLENDGVLSTSTGNKAIDAVYNTEGYNKWLSQTYGTGQEGFNKINSRVQQLLEKSYNQGKANGLNQAERKELGNLLHYIRTNNPKYQNYNLTPEEEGELGKHNSMKGRKLQDFIRLPWQTSDGRYTYADKSGNIYFLKPQNKKQLQQQSFTKSQAYNDYVKNFGKTFNEQQLEHTVGEGLTNAMKLDIAAMLGDAVSAGSAFIPGYGTAVSAVTGVGSTIAGAAADRARGESWGTTLRNAGFGLTMDVVGLIPGLGVAGKAAKIARVLSTGAKWVGPALGAISAMAYGPGAISAFKKMTSGKSSDVTAEELRDFTYAMRAIMAGGVRKAGTTYQGNRTLARAKAKGHVEEISSNTPATITTKNGQQIKLTDSEFKTLSSNASREVKTKTITQAASRNKVNMDGDEIEWKGLNPAKGRFKSSSKSSKVSGLQKGTEQGQLKWNTTSSDYKGVKRISNENFIRNYTQFSGPSNGLFRWMRDRWNGNDILNRPTGKSTNNQNTITTEQKLLPFIKSKYTTPESTSQDIIPMSRALPQPGGIHKGNVVDNVRTGSLQNKGKITLGEANQEFNDFHRMYIASTVKNSKVSSKSFSNGYGSSKEPENGSLTFGDMTATLTKLDNNRGFSITFGKTDDTAVAKQYKDIQQLRSNFAKQLNTVIKKQNNIKETAALLRKFKAKGWLKQGGTINNNLDTVIQDFFKNNNI